MLQTVHMNKKITWFCDFFIENIKMVCYNHINVRRIWRVNGIRKMEKSC